jgi:TolA-binding protein
MLFNIVLCFSLFAQRNTTIENLEREYRNMTLKNDSPSLIIDKSDSNAIKAVKLYYQAMLAGDIPKTMELHSTNFNSHKKEQHGLLSGLQLVIINFVGRNYANALSIANQIDTKKIPDVLYWRAKITQLNGNYREAIAIAENYLKQNNITMVNDAWLVILESNYYLGNISNFENNYELFMKQPESNSFKPYLLYLNGMLYEKTNERKASTIYNQIIKEFPTSQFRVQAEDRIFSMKTGSTHADRQVQTPRDTQPITPVNRIEPQSPTDLSDLPKGKYYIQFAAFDDENAAKNLVATLINDKIQAFHITKPVNQKIWFAVIQGPFDGYSIATEAQKKLGRRANQSFIFEAK